ncbi:MAG: hypothetical protein AAGM38_13260 [Pseudomonadota bacterium]
MKFLIMGLVVAGFLSGVDAATAGSRDYDVPYAVTGNRACDHAAAVASATAHAEASVADARAFRLKNPAYRNVRIEHWDRQSGWHGLLEQRPWCHASGRMKWTLVWED